MAETAPFGYCWNGKQLTVHPEEGPVRRQVYQLFIEHGRKKTVARLLNSAGYRTRDGALFSDSTIRRLLIDPVVTGKARDGTPAEALIPVELWERCQSILRDAKTGDRTVNRQTVHLFAGLLHCGCGAKMYVPSSNPLKYVCRSCQNKITVDDLEAVFFEQMKSFFLRTVRSKDGDPARVVQTWPLMTPQQKRKIVEAMTESITVAAGKITIQLYFLPSADAAKGQHRQKGNAAGTGKSNSGHSGPLKINVGARELWEGNTSLTPLLTETTKNFLSVLGLNVVNRINAPLDPSRPFDDDATATAKSALDMLRRQIGTERCKRLIRLERRRGGKPGGIRLADIQIVGTGRRDVIALR